MRGVRHAAWSVCTPLIVWIFHVIAWSLGFREVDYSVAVSYSENAGLGLQLEGILRQLITHNYPDYCATDYRL